MKNHLQFYWWKYLLILIVPIVIWCSVFDTLAKPKQDEQVSILYVGSDLDGQLLYEDLQQALPQLTDQMLKEIRLDVNLSLGQDMQVLMARSLQYDIIIFQNRSLPENVGQRIFGAPTQALISRLPAVPAYTELPLQDPYAPQDQSQQELLPQCYGFMAYDGSTQTRFSRYYTGTEPCYLFICPQSVNFDTLNGYGNPGDDAGIMAVRYLLEVLA